MQIYEENKLGLPDPRKNIEHFSLYQNLWRALTTVIKSRNTHIPVLFFFRLIYSYQKQIPPSSSSAFDVDLLYL